MCIQTISNGEDNRYLNYLDNCEEDRLYPPLRLYNKNGFIFINGADNNVLSISKSDIKVNINGVLFTKLDTLLTTLTELIKEVNNYFTEPSKLEDIYQQFFSGSSQSVPLATANVEYLIAAFKLKYGVTKQDVDNIIVDCHSLSNDDIRLKLSINKTLSSNIDSYYLDVNPNSSFRVARVGVNGMPTNIRVTGTGLGRDIRGTDINSGSSGISDTGKITAYQGMVFLITATAFSNGGLVRDTENWSEKQ